MTKYGISTNVLNTYVADFHGTTVTLFEKQSPDAPTNKPVCYDCHGVHDISRVTDPKSGIDMQQNLLVRCKECHPDATNNFPSAWMSHYIPSPEHYSLVYYVNLFYKFFIPLVLGGMGALVALDVGHTIYVKTRRGIHRPQKHSSEEHTVEISEPSAVTPTSLASEPIPDTPPSPPTEMPPEPPLADHNVEEDPHD
jgi:hypothetical protein